MNLLARAGIFEPTPIQALTIPAALEGRDVCGKARTGSGKTLAFGLPLVQRIRRGAPGFPAALVLVPTRELAAQVAAAIAPFAQARRLRTAVVVGGLSIGMQAKALRSGADIVIATPGRLIDLIQRGDVSVAKLQVAVLDEADQMADLGFLPQVERILDGIENDACQVLFFSATLDGDIDRLVRRYQHEPVTCEAPVEDEGAGEMLHRFIGVEPGEKVAVAASIAAGPARTILFVRTQRSADRLAVQLDRAGVPAGVLHGGMSQPQRSRALANFSSGRAPVLVATNIAARGIHVDGIDIVVHHDPPEDAKTYVHRSGRTARAGAAGVVVTLVEPEQAPLVRQLKRAAGLTEAIVPMDAADPRLGDLSGWVPPVEEFVRERRAAPPAAGRRPGGRRGPGYASYRR